MDLTRPNQNKEFELRGVHHLALVARDMAETVDFYENVLDMPLIKTVELPYGGGQHFFFDMGNDDTMAFFWFPHAPEEAPGISAPRNLGNQMDLTSAVASMNHVAFQVPLEKFEGYRDRLRARGIPTTDFVNHDDTPAQQSDAVNDTTWCRSLYFFDPNGCLLEFSAWSRPLTDADVAHKGAPASARERYLKLQEGAEPVGNYALSTELAGPPAPDEKFEYRGVHHLALVCSDMERTVDFYSNVLGMPLTKTLDLPNGMGQHFFFDCGAGDTLAFFWFPDAPEPQRGVSSPPVSTTEIDLVSGIGSMNHLAFSAPLEKMQEYNGRLREKGIAVTDVVLHDDSFLTISPEPNETTWVHSQYFFDPDGICLEFAATPRELTADDIAHKPARWEDRERYLKQQRSKRAGMPLIR